MYGSFSFLTLNFYFIIWVSLKQVIQDFLLDLDRGVERERLVQQWGVVKIFTIFTIFNIWIEKNFQILDAINIYN